MEVEITTVPRSPSSQPDDTAFPPPLTNPNPSPNLKHERTDTDSWTPHIPVEKKAKTSIDSTNISEQASSATVLISHPNSKPTTEFPKSDLRSYWKKATDKEKAEMNERGFQELRDTQEMNTLEAFHNAQHKLTRVRAQVRDRQKRHRDRSRERKISEGWIPGQKRVSHLTV